MRFTDKTLVEILQVMRTPGGRKLCRYQWQVLLQTERSAEQPAADAAQSDDIATWYHVCCCWSVITMASFMLARVSARKAGQTLYYVQAVDQPLTVLLRASQEDFYEELLRISSIQITKRLPAVVLWHLGMRMRFSTTLQQPLAVQDVGCTVLGFEPDDMDAQVATDAHNCQGEHVCCYMPKAIYVKIDDCTCHFLPLAPCFTHRTTAAMPSLGGYGVGELEPFESQERGFQHGHRKKSAIPRNNERAIIETARCFQTQCWTACCELYTRS